MTGVLITGASSGIGRQLALDYAEAGQAVIACGRNKEALDALCQQNANISPLIFDVTDLQQTRQRMAELPFIPQLWLFNAGCCEYIDHGQVDAELIARVFAVNFHGVVNSVAATQHLYQAGHRVAIISSVAGELALPRAEAYGASKAAVTYFGRSLALDLASKQVAVSVVCPGFVDTPLTAKNTFAMPMIITAEQASQTIRQRLARGDSTIYFPRLFTTMVRLLARLPVSWQQRLVSRITAN